MDLFFGGESRYNITARKRENCHLRCWCFNQRNTQPSIKNLKPGQTIVTATSAWSTFSFHMSFPTGSTHCSTLLQSLRFSRNPLDFLSAHDETEAWFQGAQGRPATFTPVSSSPPVEVGLCGRYLKVPLGKTTPQAAAEVSFLTAQPRRSKAGDPAQ